MADFKGDPIGASWLSETYGVKSIGELPVTSQMGGRRATRIENGRRLETYTEQMRPSAGPAAHLQFHLRHEIPHLEFLARIFEKSGPEFVQEWVNREPTGLYARRAGFLYEWLTGQVLQLPARLGGSYVDALDDTKVVAASAERSVKVQRWRVNDNLAGTRYFCPLVVKTDEVVNASDLDVPGLFADLKAEFGEDLLMRAAVWMTLRESKASFTIEGEAEHTGRVQRFADVMARRTGQGNLPLKDADLAQLQREILGDRSTITRFGVRQSPVFVGETVQFQEVVHYVAPPAQDVDAMLEGIRVFLDRTQGQSPAMRSAVAAFGFIYVHPLADGNGRVHRFLVNDLLRRDGAIPDPVILPISAVITADVGERRSYDRVLDQVSGPLLSAVREQIRFSPTRTTYPDGVVSNFSFSGVQDARPLWSYPDLSPHVTFLANLVRRTLTEQMREQSRYLRKHTRARSALKEVVEMPDPQADRVLRSIQSNRAQLSNVLAKEMPVLAQPGVWQQVVETVSRVFDEDEELDVSVLERYRP